MNGILFNHESPLRGETFVTRKITRASVKIALGLQKMLYLGNLNSKRDWGHAKDYVECMWKILQQDVAEDWVIATGVTTSVRDFVRMSFRELGIELIFKGEGIDEVGIVDSIDQVVFLDKVGNTCPYTVGTTLVVVDPEYFRPTEVDLLIGDPSKAQQKLNWKPKYNLEMLCSEMVLADLELFKQNQLLKKAGFRVKNEYE